MAPDRQRGRRWPCQDIGARAAAIVSGGVVCSIDAAQQAHVHRTQNAGQPLSGAVSPVPIGQLSGTTRELTPLASDISNASMAMKTARRMPITIPVRFPAVSDDLRSNRFAGCRVPRARRTRAGSRN